MDGGDDQPHRNADIGQHRLAQLQRRLDGLGHRVVDADLVEFGGVLGIARARHDRDVGPLLPGCRHDGLDGAPGIERDHQHEGAVEAASAQEFRMGAVAEIDRLAGSPFGRDPHGVHVERQEGHVVPGQHLADELADPPIAGNDDAAGLVRRRLDLEDRIQRLALREAAARACDRGGREAEW